MCRVSLGKHRGKGAGREAAEESQWAAGGWELGTREHSKQVRECLSTRVGGVGGWGGRPRTRITEDHRTRTRQALEGP